jgi:CO/xanthine dehydrogenase FAD-binding subunit
MDLHTIENFRMPTGRADAVLRPGEAALAGGTWLFSEEQPDLTGLVDLTALDWPPVELDEHGLTLAATCPLETIRLLDLPPDLTAAPLFAQCCEALLASFKIQRLATIGGNICTALPAGALISLCTALDAVAVVWTADAAADDAGTPGERRMPVADLVTGVRRTALAPGELLRALEFPRRALTARTAFRKTSLTPLGRSGAVVIGRVDRDGAATWSVTAATERPHVIRFAALPTLDELAAALDAVDDWYDDHHGTPDWREAMTRRIAEQTRLELAAAA